MKKILIIVLACFFLSNCSKLNIFGFGKQKSKFEKNNINQLLWISSQQLFSKYPNVESSIQDGFISTNWITTKKNPNTRFRITVYILGSDLLRENIEVSADKQKKVNGEWINVSASNSFNNNLEEIIISKAKNLDPKNYDEMQ
tara:strand:- start:528 stop:956 length:429 start_codon:yes stop_codon:yes gene_type:complete